MLTLIGSGFEADFIKSVVSILGENGRISRSELKRELRDDHWKLSEYFYGMEMDKMLNNDGRIVVENITRKNKGGIPVRFATYYTFTR